MSSASSPFCEFIPGPVLPYNLPAPQRQHLELKKIQHKYYTLKRAFPAGELTEAAAASAHAALVKQVCQ